MKHYQISILNTQLDSCYIFHANYSLPRHVLDQIFVLTKAFGVIYFDFALLIAIETVVIQCLKNNRIVKFRIEISDGFLDNLNSTDIFAVIGIVCINFSNDIGFATVDLSLVLALAFIYIVNTVLNSNHLRFNQKAK